MRLLHCLVAATLSLAATTTLHATSLNYNISYTGSDQFAPGYTDSGSGTLTVNAAPGLNSQYTAFSFTDNVYYNSNLVATYTWTILGSFTSNYGGTASNPTLANMAFTTQGMTDSAAPALGSVSFTGAYSGPASQTGSTSASAYLNNNFDGFSSGTITLTPASVAVSPEPSSLVLLGTGLLTACGAARRRLKA